MNEKKRIRILYLLSSRNFSPSLNIFNSNDLNCEEMYLFIKSEPLYTKLTLTMDAAKETI